MKRKPWTYDAIANHSWIIFREGRQYDGNFDPDENDIGRLIGTSEWVWGQEEDLKALCALLNEAKFVAPSEIGEEVAG